MQTDARAVVYYIFLLGVCFVALYQVYYDYFVGHADADADPSLNRQIVSKIDIKRANEALKLTATFINNLAVGVVVAGTIGPTAAGKPLDPLSISGLFLLALALHVVGRTALRLFLESED